MWSELATLIVLEQAISIADLLFWSFFTVLWGFLCFLIVRACWAYELLWYFLVYIFYVYVVLDCYDSLRISLTRVHCGNDLLASSLNPQQALNWVLANFLVLTLNDFKACRFAQTKRVAETLVSCFAVAIVKPFSNLSQSSFSCRLQTVLWSVFIFVVQLIVGEVLLSIILSSRRLLRGKVRLLIILLQAIVIILIATW